MRGIWALGGKSLWWDESLSLHRAAGTLAYTLSNEITLSDNTVTLPTVDNHPPVYFVVLWLAIRLFGQSEFALRVPSLIFVTSIVPLLYVTGQRLVSRRAGLAAAALGTCSPMYLWYGQEARMYSMVAALSLLSFYCFVRAFLGDGRASELPRRWPWIVGCVLASTLTVLTHHLGSLLVAFEFVALVVLAMRESVYRRALIPTAAVLATISLVSLYGAVLNLPRIPSNRAGLSFVKLPVLLRDLLNSFSMGLSVDAADWFVIAVDLLFLLLLVIGAARLVFSGGRGERRSAGWLLLSYLISPIVLLYLVSYVQPAYLNSRHLIMATPAFYLLVASGLTALHMRSTVIASLAWVLLLSGVGYSTYNYFYDPAYGKDQHREWGAYLNEHVRPGDLVVVDPPHIEELYHYYTGIDVPWIGLPSLGSTPEQTVAKLEETMSQYDRVWLAFSSTPAWGDPDRPVEQWLNEHAFRVDYREFEGYGSVVLLACYLPAWPSITVTPDDVGQMEVRFTPALRLTGYRTLTRAQPGKLLHVELYWTIDEPIPEEASVVLRLVDADGHLWGQGDQCPFNGLYPMWQWTPGQQLVDERELMVWPGTPPGTYELELLLVSRPTEDGCFGAPGQPIFPVAGPTPAIRGDRVLLGTVEVQRSEEQPSVRDLGIDDGRRAGFDGLELLGVSLGPAERKAGDRLGVTLYWEAREAPLEDAQFRMLLLDRSGKVFWGSVIRPAGDSYPADEWLAGDRFQGRFWLPVPIDAPEGRYSVVLLPEPPLRRTGVVAAVRGWLGLRPAGLVLGRIDVQSRSTSLPNVTVTPVPLPTNLSISHPLVATLGNQVRFLGFDLESDTVRPGEQVAFTLYWQALTSMNTSYTVFTHLLGPANQVVGQWDSPPHGGAYPTTRWQPGEVVADAYSFVVDSATEPGLYPIEVGMYRLEDVTRLPVSDESGRPIPGDRILLGEIAVLPAQPPQPELQKPYRIWVPLVLSRR